jgi:hypothetical protein
VARAEEAWGIREPEDNSPLTPDVCNVCNNPVEPGAKACSRCGAVFTPDAHSAQETVEDAAKESYKQTDPEDTDTQEKLDTLDELLDDPKVKAALLDRFSK